MSRQVPVRTLSAMSWRENLQRSKKASPWRMARFWKRRVWLSSTRYTRGRRMSRSSSSARINCCEKSTWYSVDSGLRAVRVSVHSAFFPRASFAFASSSSPTYAARSPSAFFLVRRMSSRSSTFRFSTVAGPTAFVHASTSLASRGSPSMRSGVLPLAATRVAKWAMTLRKGSSSPSSGAINFSLTEARYGSYSMCRYPISPAMNLQALVFPAQAAPVTSRYFVLGVTWLSKGSSGSTCRRRPDSRKQMGELKLLLNWQWSARTKSAKRRRRRLWASNCRNSCGVKGKSVSTISLRVKLRKMTSVRRMVLSVSARLFGFRPNTFCTSKTFSSNAPRSSAYWRTAARSSVSWTLAQRISGRRLRPSCSMISLIYPETTWQQFFPCRSGVSSASLSNQASRSASSVRLCLRWTTLTWQQLSRMFISASSGTKVVSRQFCPFGRASSWLAEQLPVRWMYPTKLRYVFSREVISTSLGPQIIIICGFSYFRKDAQLFAGTNQARPIISQSRLIAASASVSAEFGRKTAVSSAFHFSTALKSSGEPSMMSDFLSCSLRVVSEGLARCCMPCSRAYWPQKEDFSLPPKTKYHTGSFAASFESYILTISTTDLNLKAGRGRGEGKGWGRMGFQEGKGCEETAWGMQWHSARGQRVDDSLQLYSSIFFHSIFHPHFTAALSHNPNQTYPQPQPFLPSTLRDLARCGKAGQ